MLFTQKNSRGQTCTSLGTPSLLYTEFYKIIKFIVFRKKYLLKSKCTSLQNMSQIISLDEEGHHIFRG